MYEDNILNFHRQLSFRPITLFNEKVLKRKTKPDALIFVGLGGSGLPGDIFKSFAPDLNLEVPVESWKDYDLPASCAKNPFIIIVSFSGNTEEALSAFRQSKNRFKAAITTGGQLKDLALKNKVPLAVFPADNLAPRQAIGHLFYAAAKIVKIKFPELKVPSFDYVIKPAAFRQRGQTLARKIKNRIPVIYASTRNQPFAYNWKIRFNETAKIPAFFSSFPEMNHNEIVGFEKTGEAEKFFAFFLIDDQDHPRIKKRFKLVKKLLKAKGVDSQEIILRGGSRLEKFWRAVILADWLTLTLAKDRRLDPLRTPVIERLKKLMG